MVEDVLNSGSWMSNLKGELYASNFSSVIEFYKIIINLLFVYYLDDPR